MQTMYFGYYHYHFSSELIKFGVNTCKLYYFESFQLFCGTLWKFKNCFGTKLALLVVYCDSYSDLVNIWISFIILSLEGFNCLVYSLPFHSGFVVLIWSHYWVIFKDSLYINQISISKILTKVDEEYVNRKCAFTSRMSLLELHDKVGLSTTYHNSKLRTYLEQTQVGKYTLGYVIFSIFDSMNFGNKSDKNCK